MGLLDLPFLHMLLKSLFPSSEGGTWYENILVIKNFTLYPYVEKYKLYIFTYKNKESMFQTKDSAIACGK